MLDLILVMPVYNEEGCIAGVVRQWRAVLAAAVPQFKMIVIDDGSRDGTGAALDVFEGDPRIEIIHKPNAGHGPTVLGGYRRAVNEGHWVFQVDSDDEMPAESFPDLWAQRDAYDFLFGVRAGRRQPFGRRLISAVSRAVVGVLFGRGVKDVNTPYRLMRAEALKAILPAIPAGAFAPNVMVAGLCARRRYRILNRDVSHRGRRTGTVSIVKFKLWKSAAKAFFQTLGVALRN